MPVVLDEDTYTDAISYIIERDFFPQLAKLKGRKPRSQQRSALPDNDGFQVSTNDTTTERAVNFYNEATTDLEDRVNLNLSLDQFQTIYTSEDNASFADILEKANARRKETLRLTYNPQTQQLRLGDAEPIKMIESTHQGKNLLMYFSDEPSQSLLEAAEQSSRAGPKVIVHANTQLDIMDLAHPTADLPPSDAAAKRGTLTPWHQLSAGEAPSETPLFRGYNLVEATPTLSPSRVGTPVMTWGAIEGTPMLISTGSETPSAGPQFSLPPVSKRDALGMKLSEKASRAYRKRSAAARISKATPRTGAGLLSPAAQHLIQRSHTPLRDVDAALRSSYGAPPSSSTPRGARATPTPLFCAATPSSAYPSPFRTVPKKTRSSSSKS